MPYSIYVHYTAIARRRGLQQEGEEKRIYRKWIDQLPDLRDIFWSDEIDRFLTDAMKRHDNNTYLVHHIVSFVVRSGYRHDQLWGKPALSHITPLHYAASSYAYEWHSVVHELFKIYNRYDVNYVDKSGLTHFHVACIYGCEEVVEKFLEFRQDPNCIWQKTGESPLHLALACDYATIARSLLENGANPNLANAEGMTALHIICQKKYNNDLAEMLYEISWQKRFRVKVNVQNSEGKTPLHLALQDANLGIRKLVELLLRRGANPNVTNCDGDTALHVICKRCHEAADDLTKILLDHSADVYRPVQINVKNSAGDTPLNLALNNGLRATAKLLVTNGANPNLAGANGSTALHIICEKPDADELMKLLFNISNVLNQSVEIDARNKLGNTPLHYALGSRQMKAAELLLRRGADPTSANKEGLTPLHIICQRYDDDLLELFFKLNDEMEQKLEVDAKDSLGRTPLQWAVANLLPNTIDVLLDRGADLTNFVFPTDSHFYEESRQLAHENWFHFKLRVASSAMAVVELLEKREYELNRNDALKIMGLFAKFDLFDKSADVDERWYDDEEFAEKAKQMLIKPNLSLYDLIELQPKEATKRLTCMEYYEGPPSLANSRSEKHTRCTFDIRIHIGIYDDIFSLEQKHDCLAGCTPRSSLYAVYVCACSR
ncbi:unnamed protein product [Trichogramma brassicae]|uniref:Uncharacterized protein n=1 Tax=Trichogramma brassicae TaxID=86971 RepID=A0A6H5INJ6_9HYME|nr:unnamed protein product [Trichogramma brassicae]